MGKETTGLRDPKSAQHGQLPVTNATLKGTSANVAASAVTAERGGTEIFPQNSAKSGKTMAMGGLTEHSKQKMKIFVQISSQP